jgi:DUF438 domain-containing protein
MDPVSIIGIATTAFKGLKQLVESGRELQDCMSQLSQWAGAIADLDKADELNKKRKGNLFRSVLPKSGKSIEQEAMEIYAAKVTAREQRSELMQFLGATQGERGQREFIETEKKIRKMRQEAVYAEIDRREKLKELGIAAIVVVLAVATVGGAIALMVAMKGVNGG